MLHKLLVGVFAVLVAAAVFLLLQRPGNGVRACGSQYVVLSEPGIAVGHFKPAAGGRGFSLAGDASGDVCYPLAVHAVWYVALRPMPDVITVGFRGAPSGHISAELFGWSGGKLERIAYGDAKVSGNVAVIPLSWERQGTVQVLALTVDNGKEPAGVDVRYVMVARERKAAR